MLGLLELRRELLGELRLHAILRRLLEPSVEESGLKGLQGSCNHAVEHVPRGVVVPGTLSLQRRHGRAQALPPHDEVLLAPHLPSQRVGYQPRPLLQLLPQHGCLLSGLKYGHPEEVPRQPARLRIVQRLGDLVRPTLFESSLGAHRDGDQQLQLQKKLLEGLRTLRRHPPDKSADLHCLVLARQPLLLLRAEVDAISSHELDGC
mmetsp:Transcript_92554/g.258740  ORF Transcript_92554/g.258740 Transcript_92554/m.258740 type:complete len:205 (+) Transcript_92554:1104-1718(+)